MQKKAVWALILMLTFAVCGCNKTESRSESCGLSNEVEKIKTSFSEEQLNNSAEFTAEIKQGTVNSSGLVLVIINRTEKSTSYDERFVLEQKADGQWYKINPYQVFSGIATELPSDTSNEVVLAFETELKAGVYRVIKEITADTYVSAEFQIE